MGQWLVRARDKWLVRLRLQLRKITWVRTASILKHVPCLRQLHSLGSIRFNQIQFVLLDLTPAKHPPQNVQTLVKII